MATVDVRVAASGDDGVWSETTGAFLATALGSEFGHPSVANGPKNNFQRFALAVAKDKTITAAYLQFTARTTVSTTTVNAIISAVAADNPAAPTTYAGAETAARTTATVAWNNVPAFVAGNTYNSPDISTVIQEIVNRAGWVSGNNIIIYVEDNGSTTGTNIVRLPEAYDGVSASAPLLHVEYADDGAPPQVFIGRRPTLGIDIWR